MVASSSKPLKNPALKLIASPQPEVEPPPVPAPISGPLTTANLEEYESAILVRNARRILPEMFRALKDGLKKDDRKCIEIAAQMYNFLGRGATPSIVTNIQQNFGTGGGKSPKEEGQAVYFESIVRSLDAEAQGKKDEILDAEVVEDE